MPNDLTRLSRLRFIDMTPDEWVRFLELMTEELERELHEQILHSLPRRSNQDAASSMVPIRRRQGDQLPAALDLPARQDIPQPGLATMGKGRTEEQALMGYSMGSFQDRAFMKRINERSWYFVDNQSEIETLLRVKAEYERKI